MGSRCRGIHHRGRNQRRGGGGGGGGGERFPEHVTDVRSGPCQSTVVTVVTSTSCYDQFVKALKSGL